MTQSEFPKNLQAAIEGACEECERLGRPWPAHLEAAVIEMEQKITERTGKPYLVRRPAVPARPGESLFRSVTIDPVTGREI